MRGKGKGAVSRALSSAGLGTGASSRRAGRDVGSSRRARSCTRTCRRRWTRGSTRPLALTRSAGDVHASVVRALDASSAGSRRSSRAVVVGVVGLDRRDRGADVRLRGRVVGAVLEAQVRRDGDREQDPDDDDDDQELDEGEALRPSQSLPHESAVVLLPLQRVAVQAVAPLSIGVTRTGRLSPIE